MIRRLLLSALLACVAAGPLLNAAPASAAPHAGTVEIQTVPAVSGAVISVAGRSGRTDSRGWISLQVSAIEDAAAHLSVRYVVSSDERVSVAKIRSDTMHRIGVRRLLVGLQVTRLVTLRFVDRAKKDVPSGRLSSVQLRGSTGAIIEIPRPQTQTDIWLASNRIGGNADGPVSRDLDYGVHSVLSDGGQLVYQGQQRIDPSRDRTVAVSLLFYRVRVTAQDALFGHRVGSSVRVVRPNGVAVNVPFDGSGAATLANLPRGHYTLRAAPTGVALAQPVTVSRDQEVVLRVISALDLALVLGLALAIAGGLLFLGSRRGRPPSSRVPDTAVALPHQVTGDPVPRSPVHRRKSTGGRRASMPRWLSRTGRVRYALSAALLATVVPMGAPPATAGAAASPTATPTSAASAASAGTPFPVYAYYYIWYQASSWNRAKTDYPALGRYSSDDATIMRKHVQEAKAAGLTGFLVSWKNTPVLDRRLANLVEIARQEKFNLGIVYQGLDFRRKPLPVRRVLDDMTYFKQSYASDPVFAGFGKPLLIWTGTEQFSTADIRRVSAAMRPGVLLLASAKSAEDYQRAAGFVDGDAYYWSSVNPTNNPRHASKLLEMSRAVKQRGGLWIAPAAPGFDARPVGGTTVVPRDGGKTLLRQLDAARLSSPDAIGIISWNEFSENSHIEPSRNYGDTALRALSDTLSGRLDVADSPDSSSTVAGYNRYSGIALVLLVAGGAFGLIRLLRRRASRRPLTTGPRPARDQS